MSEAKIPLSTPRMHKIGLFHLGSGMVDVITTGVWNRIMISDLGFSATIVGFLAALRYFLAPIGIWAGRMSDQRAIGGWRRLFWIWLGRGMMVISTFMIGAATAQLARGTEAAFSWLLIVAGFVLFSLGSAFSGGTFLSLIYDRTTRAQRGRVVGLVWTYLLLGFTVGGILFGVLLPQPKEGQEVFHLAPDVILNVFLFAGALFGGLWFFSLLGEERRTLNAGSVASNNPENETSLREDLKLVWRSQPMRFFLFYLVGSMFFAFSQDAILEPWAGDVFGMPAATTSRFAAYWGSMSILGTIAFLFLSRRYSWLTTTVMSRWGVSVLVVTFALFTFASIAEVRWLVTPGLILLGIGLGIWNVGTLGLMMELSPLGKAGTFLGFWTTAVTLARGGGVAIGGVLRDVFLAWTGSLPLAYGLPFALGALGLLAALYALQQVNVKSFQAETAPDQERVLAAAMD
jgi:BCD family chlorophyll transporter-like MFS transporter